MNTLLSSPVLRWALWILAFLVTALAASFMRDHLRNRLREARDILLAWRTRIIEWLSRVLLPRVTAFWSTRAREPRMPLVASLLRIDSATRNIGKEQIAALQTYEQKVSDSLEQLRGAVAPRHPVGADQDRIAQAFAAPGFFKIVQLGAYAAVVGLVNAALLNVFFREFLGATSPLPTLFPTLQIGHVIAALLFLIEMGTGTAIHKYSSQHLGTDGNVVVRSRTEAHKVFYWGAWGALAFLALVEFVAYMVLSDRLGIQKQLNVSETNVMYPVLRYFFATFGLALTLILSSIGHALAEANEERRKANAEKAVLKALSNRDKIITENIERVRQSLQQIGESSAGLPGAVAASFQQVLGLTHAEESGLHSVHRATAEAIAVAESGSMSARTRNQVVADLGIGLVILTALVVATWLIVIEVSTWLIAVHPAITLTSGAFFAVAGTALGFLVRNAMRDLRFASAVEQAMTEPRARRTLGAVALFCALVFAMGCATLAMVAGVLGVHPFLNGLLGIVQASVFATLGGFLDYSIVALVSTLVLASLGAGYVSAWLVWVFSHILGVLCTFGGFLAGILAIPGDMLRGLFRRPPPTSLERVVP